MTEVEGAFVVGLMTFIAFNIFRCGACLQGIVNELKKANGSRS